MSMLWSSCKYSILSHFMRSLYIEYIRYSGRRTERFSRYNEPNTDNVINNIEDLVNTAADFMDWAITLSRQDRNTYFGETKEILRSTQLLLASDIGKQIMCQAIKEKINMFHIIRVAYCNETLDADIEDTSLQSECVDNTIDSIFLNMNFNQENETDYMQDMTNILMDLV